MTPTYKGVRGLAQPFLRSAAERGISASEAIRSLKESGLGTYRRTDMLRDYRQFLGIPERADRLRYVRRDYRPTRDLITETTGYQRSRFRYQIKIDCHNPVTGKHTTLHTNVASDRELTRRQMEEAGLDAVNAVIEHYKDDVLSYNVEAVFYKAG